MERLSQYSTEACSLSLLHTVVMKHIVTMNVKTTVCIDIHVLGNQSGKELTSFNNLQQLISLSQANGVVILLRPCDITIPQDSRTLHVTIHHCKYNISFLEQSEAQFCSSYMSSLATLAYSMATCISLMSQVLLALESD